MNERYWLNLCIKYCSDRQWAEHAGIELDALAARLAEAVAAVQAFADHFGPLEDNHMLNDECRHCFALARGVLGTADSASGGANG